MVTEGLTSELQRRRDIPLFGLHNVPLLLGYHLWRQRTYV